jgi:hypothetical protein
MEEKVEEEQQQQQQQKTTTKQQRKLVVPGGGAVVWVRGITLITLLTTDGQFGRLPIEQLGGRFFNFPYRLFYDGVRLDHVVTQRHQGIQRPHRQGGYLKFEHFCHFTRRKAQSGTLGKSKKDVNRRASSVQA